MDLLKNWNGLQCFSESVGHFYNNFYFKHKKWLGVKFFLYLYSCMVCTCNELRIAKMHVMTLEKICIKNWLFAYSSMSVSPFYFSCLFSTTAWLNFHFSKKLVRIYSFRCYTNSLLLPVDSCASSSCTTFEWPNLHCYLKFKHFSRGNFIFVSMERNFFDYLMLTFYKICTSSTLHIKL